MGENRGWQSAGRLLGLQCESETAWTGRVKVSKAAGGSEEGPRTKNVQITTKLHTVHMLAR